MISATSLLLLLLALTLSVQAGPGAPTRLRVEYMEEPMGIDVPYPLRFTWMLVHTDRGQAQSAYEIVVSQTSGTPKVVWDSQKVVSNTSQNIEYGGPTLTSDTAYSWTVRYWDANGVASPWAANATFTTGLYAPGDWAGAQWVGLGRLGQLRKEFTVSGPVARATAYIVGLGYYKLYMNGAKISDHELGAFTTYEERVYYDTWDCTSAIRNAVAAGAASHAVGVHLGDGWYAQSSVNVGRPVLLFRLSIQYTNGRVDNIVSDTTWSTNPGPVVSVDIYNGETYDSRLETPGWTSGGFNTSGWMAASVQPPPSNHVRLTSHAVLPPIRIAQDYSPCDMWESSPGVYVFDFCQNMAGFTTLTIPAGLAYQAGVAIAMQHDESVHGPPPAPAYHFYTNTAEINTYITKGDGAAVSYTTQFTYAGFRYVQLTGYPGVPSFETLTAHFIHTDYGMTGSISFSDPMLDAVQHITRAAAMSNFQSIPTDCPQRERRGWLGDAQLSCETNMHNFDMGAPYTSFVQQINDAQNNATGATQDCVPYYGHGQEPADPAWGAAYALIADWVGKYYYDNRIFQEHYAGITAHTEELIATAKANNFNGLLTYGGWSDWCPPSGCHDCWSGYPGSKNSVMVSSFYYIMELRIVARYAGILGKTADQQRYTAIADAAAQAYQAAFYDPVNKTYKEARTCPEYLSPQTMISLAYQLGIIPQEDMQAVIDNLVADVEANDWHLNVGIIGVKYLLPTLSDAGRGDVALMIAQARTPPSYIYMVEQGATTLWETWTGTRYQPVASWNHIMFGSNSDWYFKYLAGLQMTGDSRGWQQLDLHPQVWNDVRGVSICQNLSSVEASIVTPRGPLAAAWTCGQGCSPNSLSQLVAENSDLTLSCAANGGGVIEAITFASFGTPNGSCATGFTVNPACNANNTLAIVQKACVGQSSCTIHATDTVFGDPCYEVVKSLAVTATGCNPPVFTYNVTVPVGSTASVYVAKMGVASPVVTESGVAVWRQNSYVPGIAGITGAVDNGVEIVVQVGSGQYNFVVNKSA